MTKHKKSGYYIDIRFKLLIKHGLSGNTFPKGFGGDRKAPENRAWTAFEFSLRFARITKIRFCDKQKRILYRYPLLIYSVQTVLSTQDSLLNKISTCTAFGT